MADEKDSDGKAEKAYADAASGMKAEKPVAAAPATQTDPAPVPAEAKAEAKPAVEEAPAAPAKVAEAKVDAAPAKNTAAKPAVAKTPAAAKAAVKKPAAKKATAKKPAAKKPAAKAAPKATPAPRKTAAKRKPAAPKKKAPAAKKAPAKVSAKAPATGIKAPSVIELKEKIMATKTNDISAMMSKSMNETVSEMQTKAQQAYEKGTTMVSDMTEVAKGNVEAVVESGKLLASGMQDMGKTYADEAKSAYETATADMKEMAAIKSPTELFQLQGKIMRRNFDALVATSSKNTEAAMKLANDVMAPITARVNVAVEKISKAA